MILGKSLTATTPSSAPSKGLDPLIHETARLQLIAILNECEVADFNFLVGITRLTRGNLSTHMAKLVLGGYVEEKKEFVGRMPHTEYRLSEPGRKAYKKYLADWKRLTQPKVRTT